jgi:hypothetical protein
MEYLDEDRVFAKMDDGKEVCDEEIALSILLKENVLFANSFRFLYDNEDTIQPETIVLFVNCNDLFWWATADAESIRIDEVSDLYKMWSDKKWGSMKWCCKKRKMQPQEPIKIDMKKDGVWESWMDKLQDP